MTVESDKIAGILTNENMLATPLLVLCLDQLGTEFFDWEPESFDTEIETRFGVRMPTPNRDKVWSLVSVLTTDLFYHSLETFIPVCNSLNGSEADFDDYDPVTGEEAAWGIAEVGLVDPPEEGQEPGARFSHEIKRYVGLTLQSEGVTTPPPFLKAFVEFDVDPEENAGLNIGPDEHMLAMYAKRQQAERAEIEAYVRSRIEDLIAQLRLLPLRHGDASKVSGFVTQARSLLTGLPTPEQPAPAGV
jgi:hypothetical protein